MENQDQGDELYPIAVLIDELKVRMDGREIWRDMRLTRQTARRCPPPPERHPQALDHRARIGS